MNRITILLIAAFLVAASTANSQKVTSDAVVGFTKIKPATDVSNEQFEAVYLEEFIPAFYKEFSVPICLLKKIEGNRMEEYILFKVFESLKRRNQLYPESGVTTDEAKEGNKNMKETWSKVYETASLVAYEDYLVLPFSGKGINVKAGNIVYVFECEITLEEGMTYKELEQFYEEEYGPSLMKNFPGIQFCVLKGERGDRIGKYTELIVIKSKEDFNKWKAEDSKKTKQAYKNMGEIQVRMENMYSDSNSDVYIVL